MFRILRKTSPIWSATLLSFLWGTTVSAQTKLVNPLKGKNGAIETIPDLIGELVGAFPSAIGAAAFLFIIIGGFMMISAGGEEEKIEKGKKILVWTAVGVGILLMAYVLVEFIIRYMTSQF